ncbi:MAG: hypothetical protein GY751_06850 [Bacteroidetes bacterium]|nr:hypothetical protein [Bacteroidota bacterium]
MVQIQVIVAPGGWHLPYDVEWSLLINYLGGNDEAGGKMKEAGSAYWNSLNMGATNESGFTAIPGGNKASFQGYIGYGNFAYFWCATESSITYAGHVRLSTYKPEFD